MIVFLKSYSILYTNETGELQNIFMKYIYLNQKTNQINMTDRNDDKYYMVDKIRENRNFFAFLEKESKGYLTALNIPLISEK